MIAVSEDSQAGATPDTQPGTAPGAPAGPDAGPDVTLAKELLGWAPVVGFDDGLARTIEHFRTVAT